MHAEGLSSENDLFAWFIEQLRLHLLSYNKILIVREPPAQVSLHPSVIVSTTRCPSSGSLVLSPPDFDFSVAQLQNDRFPSPPGLVSLRRVYAFDPDRQCPSSRLNATLGVQATMWTHLIDDEEQLLYKFSPRGSAFAEVAWTARAYREWLRFHDALNDKHYARLTGSGARPASMDPYPFAAWTFADVATEWRELGWNATWAFPMPGKYAVQFHFTYGGPVEIRSVKVVGKNGSCLSFGPNVGCAGKRISKNLYRIDIEKTEREVFLRVEMRLRSRELSEGEIYVDFILE